jgi:hypothetical protein
MKATVISVGAIVRTVGAFVTFVGAIVTNTARIVMPHFIKQPFRLSGGFCFNRSRVIDRQ